MDFTPKNFQSKTCSWSHQLDAYQKVYPLAGAGIFMEMGTGKTKVAIDIIANSKFRKTLVVCPKRVMNVWEREITKHSSVKNEVVILNNGTCKDKAKLLSEIRKDLGSVIVITNYDSVWREPLAQVLFGFGFDCVIADEVHRIKSPNGKASRFMARLGKITKKRLGLTGTPIPHSPLDVYAIYRFIEPKIFGTNFNNFKNQYAQLGGYMNKQIIAYKNLEEMHQKMYQVAFRVKSTEVLDLPTPTIENYYFQLNPTAQKIYNDLLKTAVVEFTEGGQIVTNNVLVQLLRLQQITSGFLPFDKENNVIDTGKTKLLEDILNDIHIKEPIVIFARFIHDLKQISEVCKKMNRLYAEISGQTDGDKQLKLWKEGQADVLGVQIQTGGEGEDYTRAKYTIYYSTNFSLKDYEQSKFRTLRPGQTRIPSYYHLLCSNSIDEKIIKSLQNKKTIADFVLDILT